MRTITADDIAELTNLFFDAVYDDRGWPAASAKLKLVLNGSKAAIGMMDTRDRLHISLYGDCDEVFDRLYTAPEIHNPALPVLMYGQPGDIISSLPPAPGEDFRRTVFYNEWLVPQGDGAMLGLKTFGNGRMIAVMGITRDLGQPDIDDADLATLRSITPMMLRVSSMRAQLGALRLREQGSTYDRLGIGVAVLDANCRLLFFNDAAEQIFVDPASGIDASGGIVRAGVQSGRLRRLVSGAQQAQDGIARLGGHLSVASRGFGSGHAVTVAPLADAGAYGLPLSRAAMVFMQPLGTVAQGFEARVAALFGATPKEAELAAALVAGDSVAEIAERQGISITTTRSHLAQLFRKTDTSKQGQLVALLRGILPLGD